MDIRSITKSAQTIATSTVQGAVAGAGTLLSFVQLAIHSDDTRGKNPQTISFVATLIGLGLGGSIGLIKGVADVINPTLK